MPDDDGSPKFGRWLPQGEPVAADRLRIGVLVDLDWSETAGGHVKSWERLAEAAARHGAAPLDLTIHVQGHRARTVALAPHVRFVVHRPLLSTTRFSALNVGADTADLAPLHPGLARHLRGYDVIHTTDAYFAFARTAVWAARAWRVPLVTSIHTDTPSYTRVYSERILRRLLPTEWLRRQAIARYALPKRLAQAMRRKLARHVRRADWTFAGAQVLNELAEMGAPSDRTSVLRRGIDRARFTPGRRDRAFVQRVFGIAPETKILLFVGRLDAAKGVRILTEAARALIARGHDIVVMLAGCGIEATWIARELGPRAVLLGQLATDRLCDLYASADLFVFPSPIEISPNVVLEAKASGLAAIVAPGGGGRFIRRDGEDGVVVAGLDPAAWAEAIAAMLADDVRRAAVGRAARADIEARHPSWDDVLLEDLLPVWRAVVAARQCPREPSRFDDHVLPTPYHSRSPS